MNNYIIENIDLIFNNDLFKKINKKYNINYLLFHTSKDFLMFNIKENTFLDKNKAEKEISSILHNQHTITIFEKNINKKNDQYIKDIFKDHFSYKKTFLLYSMKYLNDPNDINKIKTSNLFFEQSDGKLILNYFDNETIYYNKNEERFYFNFENNKKSIQIFLLKELIDKADIFLPDTVRIYTKLYLEHMDVKSYNKELLIDNFNNMLENICNNYKNGCFSNVEQWIKYPYIFAETNLNIKDIKKYTQYNQFIKEHNINKEETNLIEYLLQIYYEHIYEHFNDLNTSTKILKDTIRFVKKIKNKKYTNLLNNTNLLIYIYINYITEQNIYFNKNDEFDFRVKTFLELDNYAYLNLTNSEMKQIKKIKKNSFSLKEYAKFKHSKHFIDIFIKHNDLSNNKNKEKTINMFKYIIIQNPVHGFISMDNFKEDIQKEYIKFYNNKEVNYQILNNELNNIYDSIILESKQERLYIKDVELLKIFKEDDKYNIFEKLTVFIFISLFLKEDKKCLDSLSYNIKDIEFEDIFECLAKLYFETSKYNMNFYKLFEKIIITSCFQLKKVECKSEPYIRYSLLDICEDYDIMFQISFYLSCINWFNEINNRYNINLDMKKDFNIINLNQRNLASVLEIVYYFDQEQKVFDNNINKDGYIPTFKEFLTIILQKELYNKCFFDNFLKNKNKKITFIKTDNNIVLKYNNILGNDVVIY